MLIVGSLIVKYSYSYFIKTDEIENIDIKVGKFAYDLTGTDLVNDTISVGANESKTFDIEISSLNKISSKYQVYYTSENDLTNVVVGYLKGSVDLPSGDITIDGSKSITIVIQNNSDNDVTITLGVVGGMAKYSVDDIIMEDNYKKLVDEIEIKTISDTLFENDNLGENCKTYNDGTDTFLVGQCSNNYVWYSGKLWRVVLKNDDTGTVKMVTDNAITAISYNASGNSAFKDSYMDQWLTQEFLPTLHDYEDYLIVDSIWDATENSSNTPSRPSYETQVTRTVGLLNSYEYYTTYNNSDDLATSRTVYLNNKASDSYGEYWWLMTPFDTSHVHSVNIFGDWGITDPTGGNGARPAVNLKSTIQIAGGTGIQADPYILEGDLQEPENGTTLLNTRYSGEYITFNNELYRIVDIENGLTKITAVDKPSALSSNVFDSSEKERTNFANASIKTDLENYYQGLKTTNEHAYNMIEPSTTWYLGTVGSGTNYKASICATVDANTSMNACTSKATSTTASIGLPRVGEMFTSQITRGTKTEFWTLTPYNSSRVGTITENLDNNSPTRGSGARPSMYLKSTVKIANGNTGNGTFDFPYSVELGS